MKILNHFKIFLLLATFGIKYLKQVLILKVPQKVKFLENNSVSLFQIVNVSQSKSVAVNFDQ